MMYLVVQISGRPVEDGPSYASFNPSQVLAVVEDTSDPNRSILWVAANGGGSVTVAAPFAEVRMAFEEVWKR